MPTTGTTRYQCDLCQAYAAHATPDDAYSAGWAIIKGTQQPADRCVCPSCVDSIIGVATPRKVVARRPRPPYVELGDVLCAPVPLWWMRPQYAHQFGRAPVTVPAPGPDGGTVREEEQPNPHPDFRAKVDDPLPKPKGFDTDPNHQLEMDDTPAAPINTTINTRGKPFQNKPELCGHGDAIYAPGGRPCGLCGATAARVVARRQQIACNHDALAVWQDHVACTRCCYRWYGGVDAPTPAGIPTLRQALLQNEIQVNHPGAGLTMQDASQAMDTLAATLRLADAAHVNASGHSMDGTRVIKRGGQHHTGGVTNIPNSYEAYTKTDKPPVPRPQYPATMTVQDSGPPSTWRAWLYNKIFGG